MSMIDFTHKSCKTKDKINTQVIKNFEEHFAMYSFTTIKNMPNIEVSKKDNSYIIKGTEKECKDIVDSLSSFSCSHFHDTLIPIFTKIKEGLKIEFKIVGEC